MTNKPSRTPRNAATSAHDIGPLLCLVTGVPDAATVLKLTYLSPIRETAQKKQDVAAIPARATADSNQCHKSRNSGRRDSTDCGHECNVKPTWESKIMGLLFALHLL